MSRSRASMAGLTPRRSTRLQTASQSAGPSALGGTPAPSVADGSRKTPLPKAKARKSNAYGANARLADADDMRVPDTGFAQGLDAQLGQAITRDDAHHADDGHDDHDENHLQDDYEQESSVDQALRELAAPSTRLNRQTLQSQTYTSMSRHNDVDVTPSAASSFMDTSKSFGLERESGMRPAVDMRAYGGAQTSFRRSADRPGAALLGASSSVPSRAADRAQRPMPPLFNGSSTATGHYLGQTPVRRGKEEKAYAQPVNVSPSSLHTYGQEVAEDGSWGQKIAKLFANIIDGMINTVSSFGIKRILKYLTYLILAVALVTLVDWFLQMTSLGSALRMRFWYTLRGSVNTIHPPGPGYCANPIDAQGRRPSQPGYTPIWDRVWDIEQVLKDITPMIQKMDKQMDKQIRKLEQKNEKFEQMEHSYEALKEYLPPAVLVIRKPDNSLEIPDEFWRAIVSKMRAEGFEGPAGSGVSEWNEFLDKNHANILNFMRDEIQKSPAAFAAKIVGQQEFLDVLQEEYTKISHMVDKKVEEAVKRMSKTIAQDVAKSAFLDQVRIESLALSNLIANSEINLRRVNYFSPSLGAQIDPHETSSTLERTWKKPSAMQSFYKSFLARQRRGPLTAIEKWDEAGECWCASKVNPEKGRGLAQLGISLGREVIPRQITIDHIPKGGTLEIDSAPRRLELWAESDEKAAHVHECSTGGKEAGWICLGTFAYNIHADNHVQTFNLDGILTRPVRKTFVRVTENWGADHTCLYRVRLHGESAPKADME